jgi:hypothetical protein
VTFTIARPSTYVHDERCGVIVGWPSRAKGLHAVPHTLGDPRGIGGARFREDACQPIDSECVSVRVGAARRVGDAVGEKEQNVAPCDREALALKGRVGFVDSF